MKTDPHALIAAVLRESQRVLFITGAGLSAESGLPTYRGIGGLYEDSMTEHDIPIEQALSGEMMRRHPEICWRYIAGIEEACRGASFNRGHEIISLIGKIIPGTWVLTQNIDGFHRQAGSVNVIDIHGDMHHLTCTRCDHKRELTDYSGLKIPPVCPACSAILRPEVVLFGERLPDAKYALYQKQLDKGFDLIFSIGTTSVFPYIAMPVYEAKSGKTMTVEINPGSSEVSQIVDIRLQSGAVEALERIWKEFEAGE